MEALLTTKVKPNGITVNKNVDSSCETGNNISQSFNFNLFNLIVLVLSVFSIISDICTDLILVVQYYRQGYKAWAVGTFVLIFFPSLIVQFFSLRWYIVDKTASFLHWVLHFCMLGIFYRYIQIIKAAFVAYKSKSVSDIQKVYLDQSDLCMLHLFESFLESAPQLVLQIYVIAMLHEWRFWTGLSALASLLSLAWALAAYTKTQRQARLNKNSSSWSGLLLQAVWRTGMLTSRISTLVLGAYCFGNYFFIIIAIHWIAMTAWIIRQKTDFCETYWEERIYNVVVGVIYCFCFFNLQEGQSRWQALAFYLVIVFQNLTCLTIFLTWFAEGNPKLAISSFIAILGGIILGVSSMLVYYRFFHPSGPIKCFTTEEAHSQSTSPSYSTMTLKSLKRMRSETTSDACQNAPSHDSKDLLNPQSPLSDSVVIVEEAQDDTDPEIKILRDWISEDCTKSRSQVAKTNVASDSEKEDAYKRRAICSSVDLVKLIESEADSDGSLKLMGSEEAPSEILSAHDYENLCAVNIAREAWGLRSWRGYSDIETWLHDDSIVHDRRLDTLTSTTTSSDRSGHTIPKENERTRQDDYIDAIAEDLAQCESEASSDDVLGQYSIESLPVVYPLSTLDPIFEENEESSISTELSDVKIPNGSASTLVATIDEIRLNTPTQNRYRKKKGIEDDFSFDVLKSKAPQMNWKKVTFASKLLKYQEDMSNEKNENQAVQSKDVENEKENKLQPIDKNNQQNQVFSSESIETKNTKFHSEKEHPNNLECKELSRIETSNKENIPTVASKINHWNKILSSQGDKKIPKTTIITPSKRVNVKERRSLFLKRVLSPANLSTFQRKKGNS